MKTGVQWILWITLTIPGPVLAGWGARAKRPRATKTRPKVSAQRTKRRRRSKKRSDAKLSLPIAQRVDALLARGRNINVAAALPLLRESVAARQMERALQIASAIEDARRVTAQQLVDAASVVGRAQQLVATRRLWQRATRVRAPAYLRTRIAEGYVDALLASGDRQDQQQAKKVLFNALKRARAGERRGLLERLVAWGKLTGARADVEAKLATFRDADAAVLHARLLSEVEGDDAALAKVRAAWRRFPGHRWLQAEYLKLLSRLGYRDELHRAVSRIVRLSPANPAPFVRVLDAHISARDVRRARKLIDKLLARYPRHDRLIESLIDREQRLGDDRKRLTRLYEALLRAGPKQAGYAEAYAEWLLTHGSSGHKKALAVLGRLASISGDRASGERRAASILQAHGFTADANRILTGLQKRFPNTPAIDRQLALLYGQIGRDRDAEALWHKLSRLDRAPTPAQRQQAAEARRNLVAMYQRRGLALPVRRLVLALASAKVPLGETLLYLDLHALAVEGSVLPANAPPPKTVADGPHANDPEVLARIAALQLSRGQHVVALATLQRLHQRDSATAEALLLGLVQRALLAGDSATARKAEALLRSGKHTPTSMLLRLGNLHVRHGDHDGAAALFRVAAVQNPRDTRAIYRLAELFRNAGNGQRETQALREIVLKTTDSDELENAGQRLLTLAMAGGTCTDLLRWLDAITPRHPRRSLLQRFRLLAYDAWLRTEPLEREIGGERRAPQPLLLSEALTGGDLAMKVRALRQLARIGRKLSPALARRLLRDPNAVVRRDATIALAASGGEDTARLLVEMEVEQGDVVTAQLLAFARLPAIEEAMPLLQSHLASKVWARSDLAALALGRVGSPEVLPGLMRRLRDSRHARPAAAIAMGALIGRLPETANAKQVVALLAARSYPDNHRDKLRSFFVAYCAMWGLAATGREDAREILLRRAVDARPAVLRRLALRLASVKPPALTPELWDIELNWNARTPVSRRLLRRLITPWLAPDLAADRTAIAAHRQTLARLLQTDRLRAIEGTKAGRWCRGMSEALDAAGELKRWCAPLLRASTTAH